MFEDLFSNELLNALRLVNIEGLNEIRLRVGFPIKIKYNFKNYYLTENGLSYLPNNAFVSNRNDIDDIIARATGNSLYAHNERLKDGYLITKNGLRIGLCGECVTDKTVLTIKNVTSILIRIPLKTKVNFDKRKYFYNDGQVLNSLIISPPGFGKTTLIKQVIKDLSKTNDVLIVDERGELYERDVPADYIRFSTKEYAFEKGVRVMSPNIIVTDEIITEKDFEMCRNVRLVGIKIIATIHAKTLDDVKNKPYFKSDVFERYIVLKSKEKAGDIDCVYDRHYRALNE